MSSNCECKLFLAEDFPLAIRNFQRALEQLKFYLSKKGVDCNYNLTIKDNCEEAVKINPMNFQSIIIDSELFKSPTNREKESCGLRIVNNIAERVRNRQVKIVYWTTGANLDLLRENVLFVKKELVLESLKRMIRWLCGQRFQNNELPGEWGTGKRVGQLECMRTFSLLKHRIAHLWLPLDIDLQGIQEVLFEQKDKEKAKEYYEKCFGKRKGRKRKRLQDNFGKVSEMVNSAELPEDKKKEVLDAIILFLSEYPDINELNDSIKKGFNSLKIYLNEVEKKRKKSFHDWFCALDKCLDSLREKICLSEN